MAVGFSPCSVRSNRRTPKLLLQRLDVAAERRLAVADLAGGGGQRAFSDHRREAAPKGPVGIAVAMAMHS